MIESISLRVVRCGAIVTWRLEWQGTDSRTGMPSHKVVEGEEPCRDGTHSEAQLVRLLADTARELLFEPHKRNARTLAVSGAPLGEEQH